MKSGLRNVRLTRGNWLGWALCALVALFMLMDAGMKLLQLKPALDATSELGWPASSLLWLGLILLVCTALYVFPPTSLLGAILLTGYLGGAVATHARISSPLLTHTLFGVYLGFILWAGLYLRDLRLRALMPLWPRHDKASALGR